MKVKDLIEGFKKKAFHWNEETQTYKYSDTMSYGDWKWNEREDDIVLFASSELGGYDCTDELRVEFRRGGIELIWEDREYDDDDDLVKQVIHRVKLVPLK